MCKSKVNVYTWSILNNKNKIVCIFISLHCKILHRVCTSVFFAVRSALVWLISGTTFSKKGTHITNLHIPLVNSCPTDFRLEATWSHHPVAFLACVMSISVQKPCAVLCCISSCAVHVFQPALWGRFLLRDPSAVPVSVLLRLRQGCVSEGADHRLVSTSHTDTHQHT